MIPLSESIFDDMARIVGGVVEPLCFARISLPSCVVFCVCGRDAKHITLILADGQFGVKQSALFAPTYSDDHLDLGQQ